MGLLRRIKSFVILAKAGISWILQSLRSLRMTLLSSRSRSLGEEYSNIVISNESERSSKAFAKFLRRPSVILSRAKNSATLAIIFSSVFIAFLGIIMFQNQISTFFSSDPGAEPVAYWNFDEGTGSTAYDTVGSYDGTLAVGNSAPAWVTEDQCVSGKCLRFDGTSDYVTVGQNLFESNNSGTFSVWINVPTGYNGVFSSYISSDNTNFLEFAIDEGRLRITFRQTNNQVRAIQAMSFNTWHHVAVTTDGSTWRVYQDAKLQNLEILAGSNSGEWFNDLAAGTHTVAIGRRIRLSDSIYYHGFSDEIKIYDYARSADQIKADYASRGSTKGVSAQFGNPSIGQSLSNGLVGYWKMDESTGVGVSDSSGNHNILTASSASWTNGKFGSGWSGAGSNYLSRADDDDFDFGTTESFTINLWFKSSSATNVDDYLVTKYSTGSEIGYYLAFSSGLLNFTVADGTNFDSVTSTSDLYDGLWHQASVVKTGTSKISLYIDGVLNSTDSTITTSNFETGTLLYVGDINGLGGGNAFNGVIDELRVYTRAFNPTEVLQLYEFAPGPVGWWKMDENAGTTAYDSAGVGITGTITLSPIWTSGKYGNSLQFDGTTNQRVDMGNSTTLEMGLADMTLEAWVKLSTANNGQILTLVEKGATATTTEGYWLYHLDTNVLGFRLSDGSSRLTATGTSTISDNNWHHVSAVVDRDGNASVYVDGVMEGSTDISSFNGVDITNASRTFRVGSSSGSGSVIGKIDQVQLYSYARTPSQVIEDMNAGHPAPGSPVGSAIAHYKLDEGYGRSIHNAGNAGSTLNGTFGTGTSAPTWTNDGKFGKGLVFDGSSDYVNIPSSTAWNLTDFTLSSWVYITAGQNTSWNNIIRKDNASEPGTRKTFALRTSYSGGNDKPQLGMYDGIKESTVSSPTALTTGWHHIVGVRNANSTLKLYVNGNLTVGSTDATVGAYDTATNVTLGGLHNSVYPFSEKFRGIIDEVKVYNFALTADQVKVEYNQGKAQVMGAGSTGVGGTSPSNSASRAYCVPGDSSTCSGPVGEWLFNEGIGTTANDTSGSTNQGNFGPGSSAPTWTKGKFGSALDFDGTSDYVETTSSTSIVTGAFTMSGWVYFDQEKNYHGVFGKFTDCAGSAAIAYDFCIGAGAGGIIWAQVTNSSGSTVVSSSITESYAGQWMHLAMVWDGVSNLKFYKNGVLRDSDTTTLTLSTDHPVRMGAKTNNGRDIDGKIDEVRLYNYVRTPAQIAWEFNQGKPIVHYQLNECTGSTVYNNTRDGNNIAIGSHGTITIGASGSQTSAGTCSSGTATQAWNNGTTGKIGASLSFDGTDDYITIGDTSLLNFTEGNSFSYSMWVKPTTITDNGTILAKKTGTGTVSGYLTFINNQGKIATYISDGTDQISKFTDTTVSAGAWSYITVVYVDDTSLTMYINGVNGGGTLSGTIANVDDVTNTSPLVIGAESDFQVLRDGQIDEVKIFNYALTPTQIKTEMANGAVRFE